MKLIKLTQSDEKLVDEITDKLWLEMNRLKAQLDTKEASSADYNQVTTSMYLTGNQILLGITRNSLLSSVHSWFYQATHTAKMEEKSIEDLERELRKKIDKLDYRLKENQVRTLNKKIKDLENELDIWNAAAVKAGFTDDY